jgi:hypothetical protein
MDRDVAKLNLSADVLEGMKEEIGDMRAVEGRLEYRIRTQRTKRDGLSVIGWIEKVLDREGAVPGRGGGRDAADEGGGRRDDRGC